MKNTNENNFIITTNGERKQTERHLLRYKEAALYFGVSQTIIERLAHEADAVYKYGKVAWVNVRECEDYLEICKKLE